MAAWPLPANPAAFHRQMCCISPTMSDCPQPMMSHEWVADQHLQQQCLMPGCRAIADQRGSGSNPSLQRRWHCQSTKPVVLWPALNYCFAVRPGPQCHFQPQQSMLASSAWLRGWIRLVTRLADPNPTYLENVVGLTQTHWLKLNEHKAEPPCCIQVPKFVVQQEMAKTASSLDQKLKQIVIAEKLEPRSFPKLMVAFHFLKRQKILQMKLGSEMLA